MEIFKISFTSWTLQRMCMYSLMWSCMTKHVSEVCNIVLAPVVQKLDSAIHQINHYPVDSIREINCAIHPLNSWDLGNSM